MLTFNILVAVSLAYVVFLFVIAFLAERASKLGQARWLRSPLVYTLSLSVYATGWTFYGAVGYAARSGLEFITIYLGPTIVMAGWWVLLRRLVRIAQTQRITSVADLISSRYGKSPTLGIIVTLLAVAGTTPYIALQLQSVTLAFGVFAPGDASQTALWVAGGLAMFTIIFGTRSLDMNERHDGVVIAIAVEAVVKLVALCLIGVFVVWGVAGGPSDARQIIDASPIADWNMHSERWVTLTFLAGAAFICLPRMFHVMVVENPGERHLATASWAFPIYLFLISLFVVPIAAVGLAVMPEGANPDLFVLTLPMAFEREWLTMLAFLGGFSAATSMVIVASIALSTMVSNHIVLPIWLRTRSGGASLSGDVRNLVLLSRRISIAAILALGYFYFRISGGGAALASMGLIAFVGVSQALPALVGGIFWRGATRVGAASGLVVGFAVWVYTLFFPSLGSGVVFGSSLLDAGPWGIAFLRPQALFGVDGMDPLVHAVFWSLVLNTLAFVAGSILSFPRPLERLQGATFVNIFRYSDRRRGWGQGHVEAEDLLIMAQRILGPAEAQELFVSVAGEQGKGGYLPDVTPVFLERLEVVLSGSVGAATAHAMLGQLTDGATVSVEDLMRVADETAQIMEYSSQLETKSGELERTARQLQGANEKLTQLSIQKDAFLGQISHELRTPMTSIRAFSEILKSDQGLSVADRQRYSGVIHDEALRLTRLLDDLLDLSVLENGQITLERKDVLLQDVLDRSLSAVQSLPGAAEIVFERHASSERIVIRTDPDRLSQVFINVLSNAVKYCDATSPVVRIAVSQTNSGCFVDFIDNGSGIETSKQNLIFEKFARLGDHQAAGGAGLGLAICREIMQRLDGAIEYLPGQGGAAFRIVLPMRRAEAA